MRATSSLTRTPINVERCAGSGKTPDRGTVLYGTVICPVCHGIARVTNDKIDNHTVRVI